MLAAQSGAARSLATLLELGADPRAQSMSDGATALSLTMTPEAQSMPDSASIIHMLQSHPLISQEGSYAHHHYHQGFTPQNPSYQHHPQYDQRLEQQDHHQGNAASFNSHSAPHQFHEMNYPIQQMNPSSSNNALKANATMNLSQPFHPDFLLSDDFRMFGFKVTRCPKRQSHDWRACPYAHPTENARRRDPRQVLYCAIPCPDYKQGFCVRGESCYYSHGVYEAWLHPSKYRTQLCKDGAMCNRPICFFAHRVEELREPTFTWLPPEVSGFHDTRGVVQPGMDETRLPMSMVQPTNPSFTPHQPPPSVNGLTTGGPLNLFNGTQASSRGSSFISGSPQRNSKINITSSGLTLVLNPDDTDLFPPLPDIHDAAASASSAALAASSAGSIPWGESGVLQGLIAEKNIANGPFPVSSSSNVLASGTSVFGAVGGFNPSPPQSSIDSSEHAIMMLSAAAAAAGGAILRGVGGGEIQPPAAIGSGLGLVGTLSPPALESGTVKGLGLPAPRMSNAFARRHGLDPKDHGLVNLQKLAMQEAAAAAAVSHSSPSQPAIGGFQKTPGRARVGGRGNGKGRGRSDHPLPIPEPGHLSIPSVPSISPVILPPLLAFPPSPILPPPPLTPPSPLPMASDLSLAHVISSSLLAPGPIFSEAALADLEYMYLDPALEPPIGVSLVSATVLQALDEDERDTEAATTLSASLASVLGISNKQNTPKQQTASNLSLRHVSAVI